MEVEVGGLGRRVLKTRKRVWVQNLAVKISHLNITPNQISVMSVISAAAAMLCFLLSYGSLKWLLAAFFIQFRLFCNMMDGLVAIEGGKKTRLGDIYNDLPDRLADLLIIVAYGHAIESIVIVQVNTISVTSSHLAWLAGALAIGTAYLRTLFVSLGAKSDYSGPMAKQHRMALISASCILNYILTSSGYGEYVRDGLISTLVFLNAGIIYTLYSRLKNGVRNLC